MGFKRALLPFEGDSAAVDRDADNQGASLVISREHPFLHDSVIWV